MGKIIIFLFLSVAVISVEKWEVKKGDAIISFNLPSEKKSGTMNGLEAEIEFNPLDPAASKISASVSVASVLTNNEAMTEHLLQPDFFDVQKFPAITFVSTLISKTDSGFIAKGELTMKGKTKNVEIPFSFQNNAGAGVFKGKMTILCGDFGLMSNKENNPATQADITIEVPVLKK